MVGEEGGKWGEGKAGGEIGVELRLIINYYYKNKNVNRNIQQLLFKI